jgi:methyl-accepting chemotaxis protein
VAELEDMQSHNAALVEQGAAASESLKSQASRLSGMVGQFMLAGR